MWQWLSLYVVAFCYQTQERRDAFQKICFREESGPDEFGQPDKWNLCLIVAKMAA